MVKLVNNGIIPETIEEALTALADENVEIFAGGTDAMVGEGKKPTFMYLHKIKELYGIRQDEDYIYVGSNTSFTDVLESPIMPEIFTDAMEYLASPAIRNVGTVGGNIGNGSAKADSALVFCAADSKMRILSKKGERIIEVKDFYKGRKQLDIAPDELIVEILLPKQNFDNYYYKKIGQRNSLAISRVAFAGFFDQKDGVIKHVKVAFGAVEATVIRHKEIDAMLEGKTIEEAKATRQAYLDAYEEAIDPQRGRVSIEYRKDVCMNLLDDFLTENGI